MKIKVFLWMAVCALLVFPISGCSPKPIEGQIFLSNNLGINLPLGGMEIDLVNAKDASAFCEQKRADIAAKLKDLDAQISQSQDGLSAANAKYYDAQNEYNSYMQNELYATNPAYIQLELQQNREYQRAENRTAVNSAFPRGNQFFDEANAKSMMRLNLQRMATKLAEPIDDKANAAYQETSKFQNQINDLQKQEASIKTMEYFFSGYTPQIINKSVSDMNGEFEIQIMKPEHEVFARYVDSAGNIYVWFAHSPPEGQKLILSNDNLFVPQSDVAFKQSGI